MHKRLKTYITPRADQLTTARQHQLDCASIIVKQDKRRDIDPDPGKRGDYGGTLAKETELGADTENGSETSFPAFASLWED